MMPEPIQDHVLLKRIWKKVNRKNNNHMIAICGDTGDGKSYSALRLAEVLDPDFSIDQAAFGGEQFVDVATQKGLDRGSVLIFDEAGVGQSSRKWYNESNIFLNFLLQTWRNRNYIAIFTLPYLDLLDKQSRGLLGGFSWVTDKDHEVEEWTQLGYKRIQKNPETGDVYSKYPRLRHEGTQKKVRGFRTSKPSEELIEPYEAKKSKFQDELEEMVRQKARDKDETPMTIRKSIGVKLYEDNRFDFTQTEAAEYVGISQSTLAKEL